LPIHFACWHLIYFQWLPCPDTFFPVLPSWLHANDIRSWYG
jgi:hypothetical protein